MSYDIDMFEWKEGMDPSEALVLQNDVEADTDLPVPTADDMARNRRVVLALTTHDPSLECDDPSAPEPEVFESEHDLGLQIFFHARSIAISIAYWHDADAARRALTRLWGYLEVIQRETGFCAYDPQLDRVLNLSSDLESVLEVYGAGVRALRQSVTTFEQRQPRPWW